MLTDLFIHRHNRDIRLQYRAIAPFLNQAAQIFFNELTPTMKNDSEVNDLCEDAIVNLCRELGWEPPASGKNYIEFCYREVVTPYDLWNDSHGDEDTYTKIRVSLLELLFRYYEDYAERLLGNDIQPSKKKHPWFKKNFKNIQQDQLVRIREMKATCLEELNGRLAQHRIPLMYSVGRFIPENDEITSSVVKKPFWPLIEGAKWESVKDDILKAMARKSEDDVSAVVHASKAIESTIKIISSELGLTTGKEKGAINYIENIASKRSGYFIQPWEAEILKSYFKYVRNPTSHGPGNEIPPEYSLTQTSWVVDNCIIWCKSLIGRL